MTFFREYSSLLLLILLLFVAIKLNRYRWLPLYCAKRSFSLKKKQGNGLIHIIVCIVDHFEPANGNATLNTQRLRIDTWCECYPRMAKQFRDSDGKVPQHTWFYPPHHQEAFLEDLVTLCKKGFGEIEMHMHHNRMNPFPEINDSFRVKLLKCVEDYSKYGIFCLPDGSKKFGFIHGDWSLDNARGEKFCGVNNEIQLLKECGCYADFTFPTIEIAQPRMINKMYYANDNPLKSKSYDVGNEIVVHGEVSGDLMIVQGILGLRWGSKRFFLKPTIETSNLDFNEEPTIARTDFWVKNAIVVKGRPQWRFIKLHTHGAREETWDSLFGSSAESMFNHLSQVYNDKERYSLHYVTAREMYNIVKAAEAGKEGNPNQFRDFIIPRYIYLEK